MLKYFAVVVGLLVAAVSVTEAGTIRQPNGPFMRYAFPHDSFGDIGRCSATRFEVPKGVKLPDGFCSAFLTATHCLEDRLEALMAILLVERDKPILACGSKKGVGVSVDLETSATPAGKAVSAIGVLPKEDLIQGKHADFALLLVPCGVKELENLTAFPLLDSYPTPQDSAIAYFPLSSASHVSASRVANLGNVAGVANFSTAALPISGDSGSPFLVGRGGKWYLAGALKGADIDRNQALAACSINDEPGADPFTPTISPLKSAENLLEGLNCKSSRLIAQ